MKKSGFTFVEVEVSLVILMVSLSGMALVVINSVQQLEALEANSQVSVYVSSDATKMVATTYSGSFAPIPDYFSTPSNPASVANQVSISQPLSVQSGVLTAVALVQPVGP